ncbi:NAD(P)/FAD-dependent oxidoreductase [Crocosphaera sp. UHCC 0190]|uniref:NAD(P)/FAD-dependent oxidoreductase n=1 Tax=Crocosphaera sp. UHCC 0190 TaxID=3110246 RepID=UPI002B1FF8E9|nr:NAD(P)/FAD-dependent oxidoreductase [Crocosphaera sp. UHCC 0190]MEA5509941.1 NAD(P)/FAD-dependent oxidoreductase [Crocosphaera sp. UHCC 0190]
MSEQPLRICIVGGGFGGLYTALRLSQLPWEDDRTPEIILIDKSDRFLFTPLLYELITEEMQTWEISPPYEELLSNTGIRFHQGCVTGIDIDNQQIQLENHHSLHYDKLVLAMGGKTPLDSFSGVKDYAIPFRTLADAYRIKERLRLLEASQAEKIRIAIVGGGYSGVELACKLADTLGEIGRIRLIERGDKILRNSPEFNQNAAQTALEARRVYIDLETEVTQVTSDSISLAYKGQIDVIPVDLVLWTVGTQVLDLIKGLPLQQNPQGLLKITPELQIIDHPNIYALGDIADCYDQSGNRIPATAQTAFQQSDYCAWNLWASITNRPLLPFRYQPLGEMMALGIDNATLSGLGMTLDGPLAYIARRLIYLYRLPTLKHQLNVGINWITQPLIEWLSN